MPTKRVRTKNVRPKNTFNLSATPRPLLLIIGGGLLILVAAALLLTRPEPPAPPAPTASGPFPEIVRISLQEAKTAYDQDQALFVDVRDAESFAADHIPGAVSLPSAEAANRLSELNPQQWIITYCT